MDRRRCDQVQTLLSDHCHEVDDAVEVLVADVAGGQRGLAERGPLVVGLIEYSVPRARRRGEGLALACIDWATAVLCADAERFHMAAAGKIAENHYFRSSGRRRGVP
jgi:hypothetical protein